MTALLFVSTCRRQPAADPATQFQSAQLHFRNANLDTGASIARRAASQTKGVWAQRLRLLEAQCLLARDQMDEASLILRSPDIAASNDRGVAARRQMLEAAVYSRRGKLAEAHQALEDAFAKAAAAGDVTTQIEILLSRAVNFAREQNLTRGGEYLERALDLATRHNDTYHQAAALLNIGLFAARQLRFDHAALMLQRVLAQSSERSDTGIIRSAALGNLSMCYSRLGDFDRAMDMRRQAIVFQEKAGLRLYLSQSFGEMGRLHLLAGDPTQAAPWFRKASDAAATSGSQQEVALWQRGLAHALTLAGDLDGAEQATARAQVSPASTDTTAAAYLQLTKARIIARRGRLDDAAAILRELVTSTNEPHLAWEAHAELARVLSETGNSNLAMRHHQQALQLIGQTKSELLRTESQITFLSRLTSFYQDFVHDLIRTGENEKALEVADATHARVLSERLRARYRVPPRRSAAVFRQTARDAGATLLTYWVSPRGSHVWVVTKDGIRRQSLPDQDEIRRLTEEHSASIEQRMEDPITFANSPGARLYDAVVRPVERFISRGSRVILVPDGPLHNINFETLVASEPKRHYWIEDVVLSVVPSLSALETDRANRLSADSRSLLIGDPVQADTAYKDLRFAGEELKTIKQHFPNAVEHIRADATPSSYQKATPRQYAVIHFAAHAEANRSSPLDSAIILSREKDRYKLYSRDVIETPIHATLVTLSACRGAGARAYSGEGLVGFAWAFLDAGARNVIAGLWDVSDRSTAALMKELYRSLREEGVDPVDALRRAKLVLLRSGGPDARPWYWGPFQVYTRVWRPAASLQARQYTNRH